MPDEVEVLLVFEICQRLPHAGRCGEGVDDGAGCGYGKAEAERWLGKLKAELEEWKGLGAAECFLSAVEFAVNELRKLQKGGDSR